MDTSLKRQNIQESLRQVVEQWEVSPDLALPRSKPQRLVHFPSGLSQDQPITTLG